ncbi:12981_t:CDS:10 [Entrophospora sp. SA101]|nr:12981_t:CDS:10 [Entrophospora sp. SA101]
MTPPTLYHKKAKGPFHMTQNDLRSNSLLLFLLYKTVMASNFFCRDEEGYGPWRPTQETPDFTLCFEDGALILPINLLFIICGSIELYRLSKNHSITPYEEFQKWHYMKLACLSMLITLSLVLFGISILEVNLHILDIIVFSSFINVLAMVKYFIIIKDYQFSNPVLIISFVSTLVLALIIFILDLIPRPRSEYLLINEDNQSCPESRSNIYSRITFYWMTPLMKLGHEKYLTMDDLWNLNYNDQSHRISQKFEQIWKKELSKKNPSLLKACAITFGGPFAFAAIFKAIQDCLNFVQPLLLRELIIFVKSYDTNDPLPPYRGYCIAALMFLTALLQTVFLHQYFQLCFTTGMRVRAGLISAIYQKSLNLSNSARQKSTVGEIVNHMSVDAQRFMDLCTYLHIIWSGPLQIFLALYLLYETMGASIFAGVGVMLMMLPVNAFLAGKMRTLQKKQMVNKDERIRLMNEILNGIKVIKLYAWESAFLRKIFHVRNDLELETLKKLGYLSSLQVFTWSSTPFLVSFAAFAVYALVSNQPLTYEVVFVALTLFNLLQFPLSVFPSVISSTVEASVALNRMENFLKADELDPKAVIRTKQFDASSGNRVEMVSVKNGIFSWSKVLDPVLENIDLSVKIGELCAIVGRVGSGKTSLLSALLGETEKINGEVVVRGSVAYVPQSGTIFLSNYEPDFYDEVIESCSLKSDIAILPGGDLTEIGERGINLSGGQKARVALARAVYSRADIYLLDDTLSAVDAHVGSNGLLRKKTRIFVTHGIHYLSQTDFIVMLREGKITEQGNFESLMKQKLELYNLISEFETHEIGKQSHVQKLEETSQSPNERRVSVASIHRRPSLITVRNKKQDLETNKDAIIVKEEAAKGSVQWSVYKAYAESCSTPAVVFYLTMLIIAQGAQIAARKLHEDMLNSVVRSPTSFFDTTPLGRILNRFSKDQYTIDEVLPRTFAGYFRTIFYVLATILVIAFSTPLFIIVIVPMIFVYRYIQVYYLSTSRELKRLDSVTRSPIYAHFQETLGGVTTIRAYQQTDRFIEENENRLDENQKAYFPSISCNRWLAVRLEFLGSLIIFSASILAVVTLLTTGNIDAGLVGLSVTYALSVTQALNWAVRQFCEIETNIVSVERVKEYIELPSEAPLVIHDNRPAPTWPHSGLIEYNDYSTRYREGLELVLKGVTFKIQPKEKIGIVGRTGAGKSSLTLSLFRLIEAVDGEIIVDGVNISKIGLYDLRSRLTIIPQDPILFEGTVAFNLDPFDAHDDVEIWQVLQSAHLKDYILKLENKLQAKVLEGGNNFSQGQRQLLCLARALLRRSPVIVLDEATASVDVETDYNIQNTIRSEFNWATLLCIAHRLRTIIDYDKVLVLDNFYL